MYKLFENEIKNAFMDYKIFFGKHIILKPLNLNTDIPTLYTISHGTKEKESVWNYLSYGPFTNPDAMKKHYADFLNKKDMLVYCVHSIHTQLPIGITTVMDIDLTMRKAEVGHIWYGIDHQRSPANTETIYLLLENCFKSYNMRRMAWRCNNENERSKNAAERLGFIPEGIFRNDMISKDKNRNTAWFSIIDQEWPRLQANYNHYLYRDNSVSLAELNKSKNSCHSTQVVTLSKL